MTYAPASLKAAQVYLRERTSLPWVSLGIVGDENHRGGYHQGEPNVPASDYSRDESSRDETGLSGAAAALDIGNFPRLRELSRWIVAQCQARTPDTRDIREVIYSPDGRSVKRWDRLGVRSSGDSSHLTHTHISYFRDSEARDKVSLFKRFFEGNQEDDGMSWDEKIDLITGQGVSYSGSEWPARFLVASNHYYTLKRTQEILAEQKASRLREEAILAAVKGVDAKAILARIDQRATEDAARDAAAAQRDAEILALVQQVGSGQLAADEVVARIGALLTGAGE
ncbi:hypothetical protein [Glycomyces sp. NPDC021274]|uniref:hypothetical protein n=1 Tax=Glycomyces sp. NPDC021274 TaxID=3155120 RepID=UPI0033E26319